jgi:hypothetical protein
MIVVLISTCEMQRQPLGMASLVPSLRSAEVAVSILDLSRQRPRHVAIRHADSVANRPVSGRLSSSHWFAGLSS